LARKRYTAEEIIGQLRTIEIELGRGLGVVDACRKLGITEQTYYCWKKAYGGLRRGSSQAAERTGAGEFAPQADCRRPSA
jgi:transposase-like protein